MSGFRGSSLQSSPSSPLGGLLSGTALHALGSARPDDADACAAFGRSSSTPATGSDTSGNGSQTKPYKTLTKAVDGVASAKSLSTTGVTIYLASGDYNAANGEKFPIVDSDQRKLPRPKLHGRVPTAERSLTASGRTRSSKALCTRLAQRVYHVRGRAGRDRLAEPTSTSARREAETSRLAAYWSVDVLGSLSGYGCRLSAPGSLSCAQRQRHDGCRRHANLQFVSNHAAIDFGIGASSVVAGSGGSLGASVVQLTGEPTPQHHAEHSSSDSTIAAKLRRHFTDGSVDVTVSGRTLRAARSTHFSDALDPVVAVAGHAARSISAAECRSRRAVTSSSGRTSRRSTSSRRFETVSALDDTWNPARARCERHGQYSAQDRLWRRAHSERT